MNYSRLVSFATSLTWSTLGAIASLSLLSLSNISPVFAQSTPTSQSAPAPAKPTVPTNPDQRLDEMFSPEIRQVLEACATAGKVNLAAGAAANGSVICADKSRSPVAYKTYLDIIADFLAAGGLIGLRSAIQSDPSLSPEILAVALDSPDTATLLRNELSSSLADIDLLPDNSPKSVDLLVDTILARLSPILKNPKQVQNLLGTTYQYKQVVGKFCTPPGNSIAAMKTTLPNLSSIQLFAICIQEAGIVSDRTQSPAPSPASQPTQKPTRQPSQAPSPASPKP